MTIEFPCHGAIRYPAKLDVILPRETIVCGPFLQGLHFHDEDQLREFLGSLIFGGYWVELFCQNILSSATCRVARCGIYDLYCFASPDHPYFRSASKHTHTMPALRSFLSSEKGRDFLRAST